ncbi:MAG: nucleoside monophosphate kinase [Verrucomicrobiota bacterium]
MKPKAFYLIGPPASGKGTHGKLIGGLPGFFHFSMGQAFRSMKPKTDQERRELQRAHELTSEGYLADDELAHRIFKDYFTGLTASRLFDPVGQTLILDGIPRRRTQAEWLESRVELIRVIQFICDEEVIFERVEKRAMLEGRADDKSDVVRTRLKVYLDQLEPMMDFFPPAHIVRINSAAAPLRVLRQVLKAMDVKPTKEIK